MTMKKALYASFLLLALLLAISFQEATSAAVADNGKEGAAPIPDTFGCGKKCGTRCINVKARPERCLKYCNLCCNNCKGCVPSGQYGNKDECPCYRDMKSKVGKPKCP